MTPADPQHPWQRLVRAARQAPAEPTSLPYGFATRVVATAMAQERVGSSLFERFALKALGLACLLMATSLAASYPAIASVLSDEPLLLEDPVAELVALTP